MTGPDLRDFREGYGDTSAADVARAMGTSRQAVRQLERRENVELETAGRYLAAVVGEPVTLTVQAWISGGAGAVSLAAWRTTITAAASVPPGRKE